MHGSRRTVSGPARWVPSIILALASFAFGQGTIADFEGRPVVRIAFSGLAAVNETAIKALMLTREGQPFRELNLEKDVKTLASEVFSSLPSVSVEPDPSGAGLAITIVGGENVPTTGVVFLGALEFDRDDLLPRIRSRRGALVDDFVLEVDRRELVRSYQKAGFHYADVTYLKQRVRGGDIIVFRITEGPEVKIRSVTFEGNTAFDKDELLKQAPFSQEPGFLAISTEKFVLEEVLRDEKALTRFYRDRGYLDARVTLLEWRPTPDHEVVDLFYRVEEGRPYLVRSVALTGVTLLPESELLGSMRTRIGNPYERGDDLRRDITEIERRYHVLGFIEARVRDQSVVALEDDLVDVLLSVEEGERVRVGEVVILGNVETKDRVLRREVELYTGEPLNLEKLDRARRRIRALGYWQLAPEPLQKERGYELDALLVPGGSRVDLEDSSFEAYQLFRDSYITLADTPRSNVKDIVVSVAEQDTGSLRFAAGVGSNSGFLGEITYTKRNFDPFDFPESFGDILDAFTGAGQFLTLSFQPGTQVSRWRVAWGDPRIFDSLFSVSSEAFATAWRREDWREDRIGWGFRVGRPIDDDLTLTLSLSDTVVDISDIDNDAPQIVFDFAGENRVTSLTLEARLDRREFRLGGIEAGSFFDPIGGYTLSLAYEHAGLWGDISYDKVTADGEYYLDLGLGDEDHPHVLRAKGTVGWAEERGGTRDVPPYERFFAGGAGTLRGWAFRGAGPRDQGDPIGGKGLWLTSLEYSFPLIENQFRGVAFMDVGSVGLEFGDSEFFEPRLSVGVGVRVVIPFLGERPVAIDFGIPLLKRDGDDTQVISFSFGSNF